MFHQIRCKPVSSRQVRTAALWIVAALTVTLRPGPNALQDYKVALDPPALNSDHDPSSRNILRAQRIATGLLLAAAASEVCKGSDTKPSSWLRRAALGVFLGTRAADAQSLPGRWPYDTFIEAVLAVSQWPHSGKIDPRLANLPLSVSRVALYLPYTQAGLSKLIHGFDAWVRHGDANHIYHSHLKASNSHPFAQERFVRPVRVITRVIPFLELLVLPLALVLPGKWRILVPCGTSLFHMVVARTWNISFWQAPTLQWLLMSVEKQTDLATILRAYQGN
ncbi:hypothetical protein FCN77_05410 [Arthrobacter sp. 24S4-2]|nr:hypothetical protein FCN77_05410 [Arthrobacter sp. 24S4-2]